MWKAKTWNSSKGIISRLAGNSFQRKGWDVALAAAAIGFAAAKDSKPTLAALATVPALEPWFLDAYYFGAGETVPAIEVPGRKLARSNPTEYRYWIQYTPVDSIATV